MNIMSSFLITVILILFLSLHSLTFPSQSFLPFFFSFFLVGFLRVVLRAGETQSEGAVAVRYYDAVSHCVLCCPCGVCVLSEVLV
jgi:hypothetical protein